MKSNFLSVLIVILTIIIVQDNYSQHRKDCGKNGDNFSMFQKLSLTETQQDQIETIRLNHQMEMIDLKANLQKKKLELTELKNEGNYSRESYLDNVNAINAARNQISNSRANFQMDVYQLLDDEQKKEWNDFSKFCSDQKEKRKSIRMKNSNYD